MSSAPSNEQLRKSLREGHLTPDGHRLVSRRWAAMERQLKFERDSYKKTANQLAVRVAALGAEAGRFEMEKEHLASQVRELEALLEESLVVLNRWEWEALVPRIETTLAKTKDKSKEN